MKFAYVITPGCNVASLNEQRCRNVSGDEDFLATDYPTWHMMSLQHEAWAMPGMEL